MILFDGIDEACQALAKIRPRTYVLYDHPTNQCYAGSPLAISEDGWQNAIPSNFFNFLKKTLLHLSLSMVHRISEGVDATLCINWAGHGWISICATRSNGDPVMEVFNKG